MDMARKKPEPTLDEVSLTKFQQDLRAAEKANYQETLTQHVCVVTFTKVDGTERVMKCTLKTELLPKEDEKSKEDRKKRDFATAVAVFDLDKNDWRAFRIESVKKLEVVD